MGEIQEVADRHRNALRSNEAAALRQMNKAFKEIETELIAKANSILDDLGTPSVSKFLSLRRTKDLLDDIERVLGAHADDVVRPVLIDLATQAIEEGKVHADELIRKALGGNTRIIPIATLSEAQVAEILATTLSGPLSRLLNTFGAVGAEKAKRDLLLGIALGEHPKKIARRLRRSLQITNNRAYLIARTETLRSYRESTRRTYQNNSHIVEKWIWSASLSSRTCAACWALHGQEFDTDEKMSNHPACRCSMVPKTKTWKELGFSNVTESRPDFPSGTELFEQQSESLKRSVLGPKAYDAYKNGEVKLTDFIHVDQSHEWGTTYRRGSLQDALR